MKPVLTFVWHKRRASHTLPWTPRSFLCKSLNCATRNGKTKWRFLKKIAGAAMAQLLCQLWGPTCRFGTAISCPNCCPYNIWCAIWCLGEPRCALPAPLYELRVSMLRFFRVSKEAAYESHSSGETPVVRWKNGSPTIWGEGKWIVWMFDVWVQSPSCRWFRNPAPVDTENISHRLQDFIHPRLCRISSINSSKNPAHTQFHSSYCSSRWNKYGLFFFIKGHHILVEKWEPMQMNLMLRSKWKMLETSWSKHLVQRFGLIVQHRSHRFERDRLSLQRYIPTLPNMFPWSSPKKRPIPQLHEIGLGLPARCVYPLRPPGSLDFPISFHQEAENGQLCGIGVIFLGGGFNSQGRPEERVYRSLPWGDECFYQAMESESHRIFLCLQPIWIRNTKPEFNVSPTDIPNQYEI